MFQKALKGLVIGVALTGLSAVAFADDASAPAQGPAASVSQPAAPTAPVKPKHKAHHARHHAQQAQAKSDTQDSTKSV